MLEVTVKHDKEVQHVKVVKIWEMSKENQIIICKKKYLMPLVIPHKAIEPLIKTH